MIHHVAASSCRLRLQTPKHLKTRPRVPKPPCRRVLQRCIPGTADALLGKVDKETPGEYDEDDDPNPTSAEMQILINKVKALQDRLDMMEAHMTEMSDEFRDRTLALMTALQKPNADQAQTLSTGASPDDKQLDLDGVMAGFTEAMSKGYLEAVHRLTDRLMVSDWQLNRKPIAMKQGVADFEAWVAENKVEGVGYAELGALYEDPGNLEVIQDLYLRLRARAFINQAVLAAQKEAYEACNTQAQALASDFAQGDFISKILPEGGVLGALKAAVIPAMKAVLPGN